MVSSVSLAAGIAARLGEFDVDEEDVLMPFRELIGALMWLAMMTRLDNLSRMQDGHGTVLTRGLGIGKQRERSWAM